MDIDEARRADVVDRSEPAAERSQLVRAVVASTIGTSIEWYDYFLYGTMAALVFPKVFFPGQSTYAGVMEAFGTFFMGFLARPVGAAVFGHYGDRIGRKATLITTLLLMGIGTFLIGLLPGASVIGAGTAVIALLVLRAAQGLGVGGEWGGSVVLSMEWGHDKGRGFITSWPQFGVAVGLLLANGVVAATSLLTGSGFLTWGWRIPFLVSIVLVAVGLYIRLGILETPVFARLLERGQVERAPVAEVLRRNGREVVLSALARMPEQAPFYIFTTWILVYATKTLHYERSFIVFAVMVAAALAFFTLPFFGWLSDRVGRKTVYLSGCVASGLFGFLYFIGLHSGLATVVFLTVALSLVCHDVLYGSQAALIAEQFTGRLRYSGASLGYQLASIVAGGPAPLIATWLLANTGSYWAIAIYIAVCGVIGFIAAAMLRDRSQHDIAEEYDLAPERTESRRPEMA